MLVLLAAVRCLPMESPAECHAESARSVGFEICLPAGFDRVADVTFDAFSSRRGKSSPPRGYVVFYREAAARRPTLRDADLETGYSSDRLRIHELSATTELIDGVPCVIDVARISGTFVDYKNAARVWATCELSPGDWMIVDATSPSWADREELVKVVRSLERVASVPGLGEQGADAAK